jgi:hypothetical protein
MIISNFVGHILILILLLLLIKIIVKIVKIKKSKENFYQLKNYDDNIDKINTQITGISNPSVTIPSLSKLKLNM